MNAEELIKQEAELFEYDGPDRVVHFKEYLALKAAENESVRALMSGFPTVDEKLGGIATGEVVVVTGRTGEGKTLFSESLIRSIIRKNEVNASIFSFEVSPFLMLSKYQDHEPIYVPLQLEAMNVDWLTKRITEAKIKHDCRIFLLDHLHFLVDMATRQNMSLNIGGFMRRLKFEIATRLNVAIILIAHQDKGDKKDEASLEGIRDSTFIAQEADSVLVVSRSKDPTMSDLCGMDDVSAKKIQSRMLDLPDPREPFKHGFATVQIAKARRAGTFRWTKLFQKVGPWMEEV